MNPTQLWLSVISFAAVPLASVICLYILFNRGDRMTKRWRGILFAFMLIMNLLNIIPIGAFVSEEFGVAAMAVWSVLAGYAAFIRPEDHEPREKKNVAKSGSWLKL